PTLFRQFRLGRTGYGLDARRLIAGNTNAGQTVLIQHVLYGHDISGGRQRLLVRVRQWSAQEFQGVRHALGLRGQRLKLDVLDLGQLIGWSAANGDSQQSNGDPESVRHHGAVILLRNGEQESGSPPLTVAVIAPRIKRRDARRETW